MAGNTRDTAGGSIQYDYNGRKGRHRIRYWATDPATGVRRRMSCVVEGTRKDAKLKRAELLLEHSQNRPVPTVGQVWERWVLPGYEQRVKDGSMSPQSLSLYKSLWRAHVAPRWAATPVDQVRPMAVQQWLTESPRSYDAARKVLRYVMDRAVSLELAQANPMEVRYVVPDVTERRARACLTATQLKDCWVACWGEWWEAAFLLMAFGGCRVGEALGVRAEECRYEGGVFMAPIGRQVPSRGTEPTVRLKNKWSRRTVVVPGLPGRRLQALSEAVGAGPLTNDGIGRHMPQNRLVVAFSSFERPDGIPQFSPRDLRPSWQTLVRWDMHMEPWIIERMMGHVGEGVTGQHYDRPEEERFRDAIAEAYSKYPFDAGWALPGNQTVAIRDN